MLHLLNYLSTFVKLFGMSAFFRAMFHIKHTYIPKTGVIALLFLLIMPRIDSQKIWDPPAIEWYPEHNAYADPNIDNSMLINIGKELFRAKFNQFDGAGRPNATGDSKPTQRASDVKGFTRISGPDANSCLGCHNDPFPGGAGEFAVNVFVGSHFHDPPDLFINPEMTSERNTPSLFGSGIAELLSREITEDLQAQMLNAIGEAKKQGKSVEANLSSKGISFGKIIGRPNGSYDATKVEGVDQDLVVKPFGAKGVVVSLREFTINALNQHHGIQAYERFGWERTGIRDFDNDNKEVEFTLGQVSALTLYQASLQPPIRKTPDDPKNLEKLQKGELLFKKIGCTNCHKMELPLRNAYYTEPNPYNRPGNLVPGDGEGIIPYFYNFNASNSSVYCNEEFGTYYVNIFTDFKRHVICDDEDPFFCNEKIRQDFVPLDQFITPRLWNVGSSMPYGHRGDLTTLSEAIVHHSGEAKKERNKFLTLTEAEKQSIIYFLKSLIDQDK